MATLRCGLPRSLHAGVTVAVTSWTSRGPLSHTGLVAVATSAQPWGTGALSKQMSRQLVGSSQLPSLAASWERSSVRKVASSWLTLPGHLFLCKWMAFTQIPFIQQILSTCCMPGKDSQTEKCLIFSSLFYFYFFWRDLGNSLLLFFFFPSFFFS